MEHRSDVGFWGLPGGGVEIGESVEQAVIREVFEETGLEVAVGRLVGLYSDPKYYSVMRYPSGNLVHYVTFVFECRPQRGDLRVSDESIDLGYFDVDVLPEKTLLAHAVHIRDAAANRPDVFIK